MAYTRYSYAVARKNVALRYGRSVLQLSDWTCLQWTLHG